MRCLALFSLALSGLVSLAPAPSAAQVCTDTNGTFRFLNGDFPDLSTNGPVFTGQLVVANADGPVVFSLDLGGGNDDLPEGLTLDPDSGLITGLATQSGNYDVEFVADDGVQQISHVVNFSVSSSGGGGNGGSGLDAPVFPDGEVGAPYTHTPEPDGDGPFTFGGSDLPPGLVLNGATGNVSGTPTSAGTYFMSLTVYDALPNEENIGTAVVPVRIFPAGSTFAFATLFLNNGEVGTPFCDQYLVENPALGGTVTFGATGLPNGLALDPATGAVTGTPTVDGTFLVTLTASDGTDTINTNLSMVIAPSSTSEFHWNFLGMPAALRNVLYDRQPPIVLTAEGAVGAVAYAATGLPAGISYDASSGELSGTAAQTGEYPVTFTATDAGSSEVITLDTVFIVLPTTGGDVSQIIVNFWVSRASLRLGEDGSESWRVSALYNADRRAANRYDPATDVFRAVLGTRTLQVDPGECTGSVPDQACSFSSAGPPSESVSINADRQTIAWSTGDDTFTETVPGILSQRVTLGDSGWRLLLRFDAKGGFRPAGAFERPAFVLSQGSLAVSGPGLDSAKLTLLLADPNFSYEAGVSTLRFRILEGATVLLDRDFTALGGPAKLGLNTTTGRTTYAFRTLSDAALTDRVSLGYSSSKGAMKATLSALDLTGISSGEAHLTFEVTIGVRVYTTHVTFFESSPGRYGLAIP
jgi:hypothetical protein